MSAAAADLSVPPPRGLSKLRRLQGSNINTNDSTNSLGLASDSNSDDPDSRPTSSGGLGKIKERIRRKSVDDRREGNEAGNRLSALIPGRRKSKQREQHKSPTGEHDDRHPPSTDDSGKHEVGTFTLPRTHSDSSVNLAGSAHSSLLTDDNSDDTEEKPVRPSLSTHPSHTGYLTLSSPEISSQTQPVVTANQSPPSSESVPFVGSTAGVPQIVEPFENEHFTPPERDTTTPVEKLKAAFSLPKERPPSDTDSIKSGGQGGLGLFFKTSSRRNSVHAEEPVEPVKAQENAQADVEGGPALPDRALVQPEKSSDQPQTPKGTGRPRISTASLPASPPGLTETPTTFVTPPTPTDPGAEFPKQKRSPTRKRTDALSSSDSIKHRRSQSANIPSKLSHSIPPPLTPTAEETKTPGGTLGYPTGSSVPTGFFSSFISAAQKTANQFGSGINIGANQKSRPSTSQSLEENVGEKDRGDRSDPVEGEGQERRLAVETLGKGDLNFGHLGLAEEPVPMASTTELPAQNGALTDEASKKVEQEAAARAVSEAYEKPVAAAVAEAIGSGRNRPLSLASADRLTLTGDQTPPRTGTDVEGLKRSGSARSKFSGRRRRHRNSSATTGTGNTIAAGLAAHGSGLGTLAASGAGHRLTGFAVASSKRNKDFHTLFRSVPEDDYLIEDYSAALQRDILLHGRLYVSEGHICFSSNILGWVTNLVISFDEVVSVEKKSTAVIFPNAIVIQTLHARNTFASFVARDSTYELLIGIWKISHPNLKSSLNGVTLDDAGTGDKTEVAEPEGSVGSSDTGSEDEVYDEDADDDDDRSFDDAGGASSIAESDIGPALSRKTSAVPVTPGVAQANGAVHRGLEGADAVVTGAALSTDFPGQPTHEPTQCTESGEHYDRPLTDTTIPAPLGKIYSMMFGPASGAFMGKWLVDDQKSRELNFTDDKTGLDNDHKSVVFDYIKPLSGAIGPKQTKCITTMKLLAFDLDKAVSVDCSTQTPDVPSGSVFVVKTRYCLMWGPNNSTRLIATCTIEWSGKSWVKGPIENGANAGQIEYVNALVASLKAAVTTKPPVKGAARKGKRKGKKGDVFDAEAANAQREAVVAADKQTSDWGILEPLHGILKPIISIISPFITSQVIIAVLTVLLLYTWVNPPMQRGASGISFPGYTSPERLVAYEEIWRREESNLWDWLEDRVGMDSVYAPSSGADGKQKDRQKVLASKNMGKKLDDERMNDRQMDDAIRVTEERLSALKDAVARKKEGKKGAA